MYIQEAGTSRYSEMYRKSERRMSYPIHDIQAVGMITETYPSTRRWLRTLLAITSKQGDTLLQQVDTDALVWRVVQLAYSWLPAGKSRYKRQRTSCEYHARTTKMRYLRGMNGCNIHANTSHKEDLSLVYMLGVQNAWQHDGVQWIDGRAMANTNRKAPGRLHYLSSGTCSWWSPRQHNDRLPRAAWCMALTSCEFSVASDLPQTCTREQPTRTETGTRQSRLSVS